VCVRPWPQPNPQHCGTSSNAARTLTREREKERERERDRGVISIQSTAGLKVAKLLTRKMGEMGGGRETLASPSFIARPVSQEGENAGQKGTKNKDPKKKRERPWPHLHS
jgi:hypothetical protein